MVLQRVGDFLTEVYVNGVQELSTTIEHNSRIDIATDTTLENIDTQLRFKNQTNTLSGETVQITKFHVDESFSNGYEYKLAAHIGSDSDDDYSQYSSEVELKYYEGGTLKTDSLAVLGNNNTKHGNWVTVSNPTGKLVAKHDQDDTNSHPGWGQIEIRPKPAPTFDTTVTSINRSDI
jgi:hypothetical protein